jgi:hypothetical protein
MNPRKETPSKVRYLQDFTTRKENGASEAPDSRQCVRPNNVTKKIELHLIRFREHFVEAYGHDRASACLRRDVVAWQQELVGQDLAPATVNNHLASLSGCTTWIERNRQLVLQQHRPSDPQVLAGKRRGNFVNRDP